MNLLRRKEGRMSELQSALDQILSRYTRGDKSMLIPALQAVQDEFQYLSHESVRSVAERLSMSPSEVFGVASFYAQFRFQKPGEHSVKVCLGTACHVRRGDLILETFERELHIQNGETTPDGKFNLERVACFGCCALAPVVVVDDDTHARMKTSGVKRLLKKYSEHQRVHKSDGMESATLKFWEPDHQ
jgi:NADH-quinone oxidoreductase subunit E